MSLPVIIPPPHKLGLKNGQDQLFVPLMLKNLVNFCRSSKLYYINVNDFSNSISMINDINIDMDSRVSDFFGVYRHLSTNAENFEKFCIARFFILKDVFERIGVDRSIVIETDVILFSSIEKSIPNDWIFSDSSFLTENKCISFSIVTYDFLTEFCRGVMETYSSERYFSTLSEWYHGYVGSGHKGGISDMWFCEQIGKGRGAFSKFPVEDVCKARSLNGEERLFDSFIGRSKFTDLKGEMVLGPSVIDGKLVKVTKFKEEGLYGILESGEEIRLDSLHFQGSAKSLIGRYIAQSPFSLI